MFVRALLVLSVLSGPAVAAADLVVGASATVNVQVSGSAVVAPVQAPPEPVVVQSVPSSYNPPAPVVVPSGPSYGGYEAWHDEPSYVVPVTPVYSPPPPTVVVQPVPVQPVPTYYDGPVTTVVPAGNVAPACGGCDCPGGCGMAYGEARTHLFDLVAFGAYRHVFQDTDLGGFNTAIRFLLLDSLSLEAGVGYFAGGTPSGGNHEELPFTLNLLWYPWTRESPFYVAGGVFAGWAGVWQDPFDPTFDQGWNEDQWFAGGRVAAGLEFEVWDFLLLGAEVEAFYRSREHDGSPDGEAGVSVSLGLGLRI